MTDLADRHQVRRFIPSIKRFVPPTLFGRALLIIVTPLILMHGISTFVFFDRHWDTMARRLSQSLAGEVALVVNAVTPLPPPEEIDDVIGRASRFLGMKLTFEPGQRTFDSIVTGSGYDPVKFQLVKAMNERVKLPFEFDAERGNRRLYLHVQLPDGVLTVNIHKNRLYSSTPYVFLMWMVGSSLILFAIAIIFMRNQIRPVKRLAAAARRFGIGRDVDDFKPEGAAEVRQAAQAFRQMQRRIRRQLNQRTEMLAGVSHDLRTPLTRMKLQLAMLGDSDEIDRLKYDVHDMERMVEGYLAFARGEGTETPVVVNLCDLVSDIVDAARRDGTGITLTITGDRSARYEARPQALKRAIDNLVANAKSYATITAIHLDIGREIITITIDDDGPGIPPEHRTEVFKPFFRLDPSRNPNTGGVGLGLTITRDIVRGHGGELKLETSHLGGLRATISVPV